MTCLQADCLHLQALHLPLGGLEGDLQLAPVCLRGLQLLDCCCMTCLERIVLLLQGGEAGCGVRQLVCEGLDLCFCLPQCGCGAN